MEPPSNWKYGFESKMLNDPLRRVVPEPGFAKAVMKMMAFLDGGSPRFTIELLGNPTRQ